MSNIKLEKENDYLIELVSRINFECNQVIHKGTDADDAIRTIKILVSGSIAE